MPIGGYDAVIKFGTTVDTSQLVRQISAVTSRVPPLRVNVQNAAVLGRISGEAKEFASSLQAANARVVAFGASAGSMYAVARAIREVVKATIDVEKQLADINVVLGLSDRKLGEFSKRLFDIANLTGQSFKTAADAALEFSRQGLTLEQTLKRTQDALTLTRLSGLQVIDSVKSITAVLNGFNDATLDSTKLINKLATVDLAFAVSAGDLATAFQRVGSSAKDTGVELDSLIGLVTATQQITARGGAVIGNSFKSIFTRLQRSSTLDTLRQFNVEIEDLEGNVLSSDRILQNLAKTYKNLDQQQKNYVVNLAAGLFQANQFRAILGDLAKENSLYARATQISATATNQAAQRQAELNKTLAASVNELFNNLTKVEQKLGQFTVKPVLDNITKILGYATQKFEGAVESNKTGFSIGEGILKGLGNYLSGPGLATITALAAKLFSNFVLYTGRSFTTILETLSRQFRTQQAINQVLAQQPALQEAVSKGALNQVQLQNAILTTLRAQNVEYARQGQFFNAAKTLIARGAITAKGGNLALNVRAAKAEGYVPEPIKTQEAIGAFQGGYIPGRIKPINVPRLGKVYYNTAEKIRQFPQFDQPAIMPPKQSKAGIEYRQKFERKHGFNPYVAGGFVPNFAGPLDLEMIRRLYNGVKIGVNAQFQREFSHAVSKPMREGRLSQADLNEIIAFFRGNPVIDGSRIIDAVPSRYGIKDEHEINFLLPSKDSMTGIQMVFAINKNDLSKTRIISVKNRTGIANEGFVPNFNARLGYPSPQSQIPYAQLSRQVLSSFSSPKELLKYVNSLNVYKNKGSSRIFIPINDRFGVKIAANQAGLAQNEVEFPILNEPFARRHYGDILPRGFGFDENNFRFGFVERLRRAFSTSFRRETRKPKQSFLMDAPFSPVEEKIMNFTSDYNLGIGDFMKGRNIGVDKNRALKLLDIGLNEEVLSTFYRVRNLGKFNKGFIPSFARSLKPNYLPADISDDQLKKYYRQYAKAFSLNRQDGLTPTSPSVVIPRMFRNNKVFQYGESAIFGNMIGPLFTPQYFSPSSPKEGLKMLKELKNFDNIMFMVPPRMQEMLGKLGYISPKFNLSVPWRNEVIKKGLSFSSFKTPLLGIGAAAALLPHFIKGLKSGKSGIKNLLKSAVQRRTDAGIDRYLNTNLSGGFIPNFAYIPGITQLAGRFLTNVTHTQGYGMLDRLKALKGTKISDIFKAALRDQPLPSATTNAGDIYNIYDRDILFRSVFGLKPRKLFPENREFLSARKLVQTSPSTYRLTNRGRILSNILKSLQQGNYQTSGGGISLIGQNKTLGGFDVNIDPRNKTVKYNDLWDFALGSGEPTGIKELLSFGLQYGTGAIRNRSFGLSDTLKQHPFLSGNLHTGTPYAGYQTSPFSNLARTLVNSIIKKVNIQDAFKPLSNTQVQRLEQLRGRYSGNAKRQRVYSQALLDNKLVNDILSFSGGITGAKGFVPNFALPSYLGQLKQAYSDANYARAILGYDSYAQQYVNKFVELAHKGGFNYPDTYGLGQEGITFARAIMGTRLSPPHVAEGAKSNYINFKKLQELGVSRRRILNILAKGNRIGSYIQQAGLTGYGRYDLAVTQKKIQEEKEFGKVKDIFYGKLGIERKPSATHRLKRAFETLNTSKNQSYDFRYSVNSLQDRVIHTDFPHLAHVYSGPQNLLTTTEPRFIRGFNIRDFEKINSAIEEALGGRQKIFKKYGNSIRSPRSYLRNVLYVGAPMKIDPLIVQQEDRRRRAEVLGKVGRLASIQNLIPGFEKAYGKLPTRKSIIAGEGYNIPGRDILSNFLGLQVRNMSSKQQLQQLYSFITSVGRGHGGLDEDLTLLKNIPKIISTLGPVEVNVSPRNIYRQFINLQKQRGRREIPQIFSPAEPYKSKASVLLEPKKILRQLKRTTFLGGEVPYGEFSKIFNTDITPEAAYGIARRGLSPKVFNALRVLEKQYAGEIGLSHLVFRGANPLEFALLKQLGQFTSVGSRTDEKTFGAYVTSSLLKAAGYGLSSPLGKKPGAVGIYSKAALTATGAPGQGVPSNETLNSLRFPRLTKQALLGIFDLEKGRVLGLDQYLSQFGNFKLNEQLVNFEKELNKIPTDRLLSRSTVQLPSAVIGGFLDLYRKIGTRGATPKQPNFRGPRYPADERTIDLITKGTPREIINYLGMSLEGTEPGIIPFGSGGSDYFDMREFRTISRRFRKAIESGRVPINSLYQVIFHKRVPVSQLVTPPTLEQIVALSPEKRRELFKKGLFFDLSSFRSAGLIGTSYQTEREYPLFTISPKANIGRIFSISRKGNVREQDMISKGLIPNFAKAAGTLGLPIESVLKQFKTLTPTKYHDLTKLKEAVERLDLLEGQFKQLLPGQYKQYEEFIQRPDILKLLKNRQIVTYKGKPLPFFHSSYSYGTYTRKGFDQSHRSYLSPDLSAITSIQSGTNIFSGLLKSSFLHSGPHVSKTQGSSYIDQYLENNLEAGKLLKTKVPTSVIGNYYGFPFLEAVVNEGNKNFLQFGRFRLGNIKTFRNRLGRLNIGGFFDEGLIPNFTKFNPSILRDIIEQKGLLGARLPFAIRNKKQIEIASELAARFGVTARSLLLDNNFQDAFRQFIPNFVNTQAIINATLQNAILREKAAGVPSNLIRVDSSPKLVSPINPAGLGVYNLRDEPTGLHQGITRVANQGLNPKMAGVPNFAPAPTLTRVDRLSRISPLTIRQSLNIENEIIQLKSKIKTGLLAQSELNSSVKRLSETYKLSATSQKTVQQRLQRSYNYFNPQTNPAIRNQLTGGTTVNPITGATQLTFGSFQQTKYGRQGEFVGLIQQAKLQQKPRPDEISGPGIFGTSKAQFDIEKLRARGAREDALARIRPFQRLERLQQSNLLALSRNDLAKTFQQVKASGAGLPEDLKRQFSSQLRETVQKANINNKLLNLQASASRLGGFSSLFGQGRKDYKELLRINPQAAQGIRQQLQGKAFTASFVLPIFGGLAQEAFGNRTARARGFGQTAAGLANIAGFSATGFAIGGPAGGLIGLGAGLLFEVPKAIRAFSDTLPDLQRRLGELKDTSQKTTASLESFISASEKLNEISKTGGVTLGQKNLIQREALAAFSAIPRISGRKRVAELVGQGSFVEARITAANIGAIQAAQQNLIGIQAQYANFKRGLSGRFNKENLTERDRKLLTDIEKAQEELRSKQEGAVIPPGGEVGITLPTSPINAKEIQKIQERITKSTERFFNESDFAKSFEEVAGQFLSLQDTTGKNFSDIFLTRNVLGNAKNLNEAATNLRESFAGKIDDSAFVLVDEFATSLTDASKNLGPELSDKLFEKIRDTFSQQGLQEIFDSFQKLDVNNIRLSEAIFNLNQRLLEAQRGFEDLGTSIAKSQITRLGELTGNLAVQEIRQKTFNQLRSTQTPGEGLQNVLNFQEKNLQNINQARTSRQQLQGQINVQVSDLITKFREDLTNRVVENLKRAFERSPEKIELRIRDLTQASKEIYDFVDQINNGLQITPEVLREINDVVERNTGTFQKFSKLGGIANSIIKLREQYGTGQEFYYSFLKEAEKLNLSKYFDQDQIDKLRTASNELLNSYQAQGNTLTDLVTDLGKALQQTNRQLEIESTKIETQLKNADKTTLAEFESNRELIGKRFAIQQFRFGRTAETNRRVSQLQNQFTLQEGAAPAFQLIGLQSRKRITGTIGDLVNQLTQAGRTDLGLNVDNFENQIGQVIEKQKEVIKNAKISLEFDGSDAAKQDLEEAGDTLKLLITLQDTLNQAKQDEATTTKFNTELTKRLLSLQRDRVEEQRRLNESNARQNQFDKIRRNLGNTLFTTLDFTGNDFWDSMSRNVLEFGEDLKTSFKQGFREAITGAEDFGEAMRKVGLSISANILSRISDLALDQLFGLAAKGGRNLFNIPTKFNGGLINKYAMGGLVSGGSGIRDDIPALLSGGEFVLNNRAVKNLGVKFLDGINKFADGGSAQDFFAFTPRSARIRLANEYFGVGGTKERPESGRLNVSRLLSAYALTDENNPQNALRDARRRYFAEKTEYENQINEQLKKFENQKLTSLYTSLASTAISVGAAGLQGYLSGPSNPPGTALEGQPLGTTFNPATQQAVKLGVTNPFESRFFYNFGGIYKFAGGAVPRRYNFGGNVFGGDTYADNIPALLAGGEFVVNSRSAQNIGVERLNYMNKTGRVPGFIGGGYVGAYSPSNIAETNDISRYFNELIGINEQIRDNIGGNRPNTQQNTNQTANNAPVFNISTNIIMSSDGVKSETSVSSSNNTQQDNRNNGLSEQQAKELGAAINKQVKAALSKETRQGGILDSIYKKK